MRPLFGLRAEQVPAGLEDWPDVHADVCGVPGVRQSGRDELFLSGEFANVQSLADWGENVRIIMS